MLVERLLCEARKLRKDMKELEGYTPGDPTEYQQDFGAWLDHHKLDLDFPRRAAEVSQPFASPKGTTSTVQ